MLEVEVSVASVSKDASVSSHRCGEICSTVTARAKPYSHGIRSFTLPSLERHQQVTGGDLDAAFDEDLGDLAIAVGGDVGFHFHGFQ